MWDQEEQQKVVPMNNIEPPHVPVPPPVDYSKMIAIIAAWVSILNARLLALLALTGAIVSLGCVMYSPEPLRLWGLGIYSVLCLWPAMALYMRKG